MSNSQTETRGVGKTYIDEQPEQDTAAPAPPSPTLSGSSISEESDGEPDVYDRPSAHDELLASLPIGDEEDSDIDEMDVEELRLEDEDWELADGDFTKQYNRMRQAREVMQTSSTARPLPARNAAAAQTRDAEAGSSRPKPASAPSPSTAGISTNPKAQERKVKDKSDRATTEGVLDQRTKKTLSAFMSRGVIGKMTGCISTGKEANVYHSYRAENPPGDYPEHLAIKIYRTSILGFRSRQEYMEGEHRFRNEYTSSKNPRKMVKLWAEKEFRNLRRLAEEGIRSPRAMECKENVLVIEFLGGEEQASPRLKDADVDEEDLPQLYAELLVTIRRMFQDGKLVHADLSEYNILYHNGHLYIIDVSQSVEQDHPRAFDFLRMDLQNIDDYFKKRSSGAVRTLGLRRSWDFVTAEELSGSEEDLMDEVYRRMEEDAPADSDDAFLRSFIPRALAEIRDPEKLIYGGGLADDAGRAKLIADPVAPTTVDVPAAVSIDIAGPNAHDAATAEDDAEKTMPAVATSAAGSDHGEGESEGDSGQESDTPAGPTPQNRGFRHEDKDEKRARKQAVKDENREKRKHKMPKAQKSKLVKKTAR